jgi:hypothetical protein
MSVRKRSQRKDPVRSSPIRNFSGLYKGPNLVASSVKSEDSDPSAKNPAGQAQVRGSGTVERAYKLIDKYVNEGKKDASQINDKQYNNRSATDGFQNILEKTIRYQRELMPLWLEALGSAVSVDRPRNPSDRWPVGRPDDDSSRGVSRAISIEVVSSRPAQISIDLRENSESAALLSLGLRAVEENKPFLGDVSFAPETTGAAIKLRVSIPDSLSPGNYLGVIVDRNTGEACGTLSVRIAEHSGTVKNK